MFLFFITIVSIDYAYILVFFHSTLKVVSLGRRKEIRFPRLTSDNLTLETPITAKMNKFNLIQIEATNKRNQFEICQLRSVILMDFADSTCF